MTPSISNGTDFGAAHITVAAVKHTFRIWNTGNANLNLTGSPHVSINGTNAEDFTVTTQPVSTIGPNTFVEFEVIFNPSALGLRTTVISIANNDTGEDPYNFTIREAGFPISSSCRSSCVNQLGQILTHLPALQRGFRSQRSRG